MRFIPLTVGESARSSTVPLAQADPLARPRSKGLEAVATVTNRREAASAQLALFCGDFHRNRLSN